MVRSYIHSFLASTTRSV